MTKAYSIVQLLSIISLYFLLNCTTSVTTMGKTKSKVRTSNEKNQPHRSTIARQKAKKRRELNQRSNKKQSEARAKKREQKQKEKEQQSIKSRVDELWKNHTSCNDNMSCNDDSTSCKDYAQDKNHRTTSCKHCASCKNDSSICKDDSSTCKDDDKLRCENHILCNDDTTNLNDEVESFLTNSSEQHRRNKDNMSFQSYQTESLKGMPKQKGEFLKRLFKTMCDESLNNLGSNQIKCNHSHKHKRTKRNDNYNSSNGTACECVLSKQQDTEFLVYNQKLNSRYIPKHEFVKKLSGSVASRHSAVNLHKQGCKSAQRMMQQVQSVMKQVLNFNEEIPISDVEEACKDNSTSDKDNATCKNDSTSNDKIPITDVEETCKDDSSSYKDDATCKNDSTSCKHVSCKDDEKLRITKQKAKQKN